MLDLGEFEGKLFQTLKKDNFKQQVFLSLVD